MKKGLLSVMLAALVLAGSLVMTGCAAEGDAPAAGAIGGRVELSPDNPVTISIWIASNQMPPAPDNKISALLEERLGVTLVYEITPLDLQDQRIGTLLAGGDLPDLIGSIDLNALLLQGGALRRLDDYLDTGNWPNLAAHVEPYLGRLSWTGGGVEDGFYIFPNWNRFYGDPPIMSPTHWHGAFYIQKSVLEWHGFPSLENMTLERYFQLIEEYKIAHPMIDGMPTVGFGIPMFPGRVHSMTNPPNFLAGFPDDGPVMVDVATGQARIFANSVYAERYFRILNEMFNRGLIDPETFTFTLDQWDAQLATGRVLGFHDARWALGNPWDSLLARGLYERTWVATMPTFDGRAPRYASMPVLNINMGMSISSSAENPELLLTFLDTLMEEEWQIILAWGIEGEDYYVDENGVFYRSDAQRANAADLTWRASNRLEALFDIMPKREGTLSCGNAFVPANQPGEFFDSLSEYFQFFLESYNKQTWMEFLNPVTTNPPHFPAWQAHLPAGSAAQLAQTQLDEVAAQFLPVAIMAPVADFDARWQDYIDAIDRIDVEAFEAAFTEFVQYRQALWGN